MTDLLMNVFGGLAIFILGMKMMSDGLHIAAGERMRTILRFFAANRGVAILSGTAVTAVIQSSSASTVMVIGFVNAGLLNLTQAIGIIFGANIGTTVTAQLVAFEISWIIMPAIILGLLTSLINRPVLRGWGETIIGLGLLFLGMQIMSDELKVLATHQGFLALFSSFDCAPRGGWIPPGALLGAIAVGLGTTMIIQSSSACSGIVIALGGSGVINLYTAVALVLGSNIGTTVTAVLAALPANRIAKQAALAHTLFNVIGVLVIVSTFWLRPGASEVPLFFRAVDSLSSAGDLPRRIANAHTLFNVFTTLLLTPFIPLLARICETVIPRSAGKVKFELLDSRLLATPAIALDQTAAVLRRMLKKAWRMVDCALNTLNHNDKSNQARARQLMGREAQIDEFQRTITDYLAALMQKKLLPVQAEAIPLLIHCTNDVERIGDHTEVIVELIGRLRESGCKLSSGAENEIDKLHDALAAQSECALGLLAECSPAALALASELSERIPRLADEYEADHIRRFSNGKCAPAAGIFYIELLAEFRKISRHLTNITERAELLARLEK